MKILYVHQHFNTPKGAGGIRSYQFAKYFLQQGHQVHVLCGHFLNTDSGLTESYVNGTRHGYFEGIEITQFQIQYANNMSFLKRSWSFIKFVLSCLKLVMTEKYDLIYATSTPLTVGILGIFAKIFRRKKFIFEVRDLWPELPKAMGVIRNPVILFLMDVLERLSYFYADSCIGLSPGMIEGIKEKSSSKKPVFLVPNGCDNFLFKKNEKNRDCLPKEFQQDFLVGYFGTIGMANGLDFLIQTAQALKTKSADHIRILIYGEGQLKKSLQDKVTQMALKNVHFMGTLTKEKVVDHMAAMDAGLMILKDIPAFYRGTSPNKFFDYISAGIPVCNNLPGWVAELIDQSQCGFTSSNPEEFAQKLISLSTDPERLARMGKNALTLAKSDFDRQVLAKKCLEVVEMAAR